MGAEYDFETVLRFTDMACFTDVVQRIRPHNPDDSLREKFDYSIKERGLNLSPGERQRLALARGFLACQSKDIVLLDEPTSSTDANTGMRIHENFVRGFSDKTILSATHQLHLLPFFHRIFFVDDGKIVATGTLDELLLHCPGFQALWRRYHEHRHETST
jgi:ABC-type multidrug transport system fused ATPase/permease subunit